MRWRTCLVTAFVFLATLGALSTALASNARSTPQRPSQDRIADRQGLDARSCLDSARDLPPSNPVQRRTVGGVLFGARGVAVPQAAPVEGDGLDQGVDVFAARDV